VIDIHPNGARQPRIEDFECHHNEFGNESFVVDALVVPYSLGTKGRSIGKGGGRASRAPSDPRIA